MRQACAPIAAFAKNGAAARRLLRRMHGARYAQRVARRPPRREARGARYSHCSHDKHAPATPHNARLMRDAAQPPPICRRDV